MTEGGGVAVSQWRNSKALAIGDGDGEWIVFDGDAVEVER